MSKLIVCNICAVLVLMPLVHPVRAEEEKNARDPFWPVGYKKPEPKSAISVPEIVVPDKTNGVAQAAPVKPDPLLMEKVAAELQLKIRQNCMVGGFLKSGEKNMAFVNGQIKSVGDTLTIEVDAASYRFKVVAITPTSIKIEPVE
jgi:hypothetical protein